MRKTWLAGGLLVGIALAVATVVWAVRTTSGPASTSMPSPQQTADQTPAAQPTDASSSGGWPTQPPFGREHCKENGDWRTYLGAWDGHHYANELPRPAWWTDGSIPYACTYHFTPRFVRATSIPLGDKTVELEWVPHTPDSVEIHPLLDNGNVTWERQGSVTVTVTHHHLSIPGNITLLILEDDRVLLLTKDPEISATFPVRRGHQYQIAVTISKSNGYPVFETEDGLGPNQIRFDPSVQSSSSVGTRRPDKIMYAAPSTARHPAAP